MNEVYSLPPLRDLPTDRLELRAAHLRSELEARSTHAARRRAILALAAVAVVLTAALVATPAFGLRDGIAHLFGAKEGPPELIERYFSNQSATPGVGDVLAKKARLAVQVSIAGYGHQSLWVAPTRSGGFCTTAPRCNPHRSVALSIALRVAGPTSRHAPDPSKPRDVHVLVEGATVVRGAANLAASYEDGSVERVPVTWVSEPIDAGFFIYEIPESHWDAGKRLVALAVEDVDGRVLERETTTARDFRRVQKAGLALSQGTRPKVPAAPPPPSTLCSDACRDPEGDAGSSLDITKVDVKEWDSGIEVHVSFHGAPAGLEQYGPLVALDLDRNPDTGSAYYGTEVEVAFVGGEDGREAEPALYEAHGWNFVRASPGSSLGFASDVDSVSFVIPRALLGRHPERGFAVVASSAARHPDTAPDVGTFNVGPSGGTHRPLGPDKRAPKVFALDSLGTAGKDAKLEYWVLEGRGQTRQVIRIFRGHRLLKTLWTPLANANPFGTSATTWHVPRGMRGTLGFTVRSIDAAGNRSSLERASLVLR
jgi:hypothetical protein